MKSKTLLSLVFVCLAVSGSLVCYGQSQSQMPTSDQVAIAVRFTDQGPGQAVEEYYGIVEKKDLAALLSGPAPGSFLKLNNVIVLTGTDFLPLSDAGTDVTKYGYGTSLYVREDTIFRIVELDDAFVKARWGPKENKP